MPPKKSPFKIQNRVEVVIYTQPKSKVKSSSKDNESSDVLPKPFEAEKKKAEEILPSAPRKQRSKKQKARRADSSDEEASGDEVDSDHIVKSRLRTRGKSSRGRDFLLENLKRKRQGLAPLKSPPPDTDTDTSDDSSDDSASSWDSLFDESDFIVDDDGATAPPLPKEFSMVESGPSSSIKSFKYIERPAFMSKMLKDEEYFSVPYRATTRRFSSIRDSLASLRWKPTFTDLLEKYPELKMQDLPGSSSPVCDVCHKQGGRSCKAGQLSGIPYNRLGFGELDDEFLKKKRSKTDSDKSFNVGRFCAERTLVFHKICHWEYELFTSIAREVDELREMKQSSGFFNDRDVFVPIKEHDVKDDAIFEWLKKRNKVEMEWQKIQALLTQAQNVDQATKRGKTD
ncbi:hypothetical protein R3P38DRAFT_2978563 [Favolaschia claudopus]|uniref:DUF4211 domain-containing protein n=1 Tax=Favolaschia claudopus TaxID=2862362 RepID=A0AAW0B0Z9_9AGAR